MRISPLSSDKQDSITQDVEDKTTPMEEIDEVRSLEQGSVNEAGRPEMGSLETGDEAGSPETGSLEIGDEAGNSTGGSEDESETPEECEIEDPCTSEHAHSTNHIEEIVIDSDSSDSAINTTTTRLNYHDDDVIVIDDSD